MLCFRRGLSRALTKSTNLFCPNCKLEYRRGFTRCSDCHVDLVESLEGAHTNALRDPDALELLWSGPERRMFDALIHALTEAGIDVQKRAQDVGLIPGLMTKVYSIATQSKDLDAARGVLDAVTRELNTAAPSPSRFGSRDDDAAEDADVSDDETSGTTLEDDDSIPGPPENPSEDFYAEDATAEVWSGTDVETEEMLVACLHENGIGCVVNDASEPPRICVMPASQARAKQIVREVVEATPPE